VTTTELARLCAEAIQDQVVRNGVLDVDTATHLILGALNRALDEQTRSVSEVINVESGHVSVDVGTTAKGELTYSAKVVMPFVGADAAAGAREDAQAELERAEAFLRERYGRSTS
jgi:hypothetical protein